MKYFFAFFCVSLLSFKSLQAQDIQVKYIQFAELENLIGINDDTLRVINFWATWCKPCVEELPYFEKLRKEYVGQKVLFVFVSMDFKNKIETQVIPLIKRLELGGQHYVLDQADPDSWINKIHPSWSGAIPATLFVNNQKKISHFHEGSYDYETLKSKLIIFTQP